MLSSLLKHREALLGAVIVLIAFLLIGLSGRLDKPARVALG